MEPPAPPHPCEKLVAGKTSAVFGRAVDARTREPLAGVTLVATMYSDAAEPYLTTISDDNGCYAIFLSRLETLAAYYLEVVKFVTIRSAVQRRVVDFEIDPSDVDDPP